MNKNIRRLIEQAGETEVVNVVDIGDGYMETQVVKEFDREWFAELIVAECMQIIKVDMYEDAISNMWSKNKLQMIKEHFGVEE